jgi:hypothetical protein
VSDRNNDLGNLFRNLRPKSKHSLAVAIQTATTEGLSGTLIIEVPASIDKPTEAYFTTSDLKLIPAIRL